MPFMGMAGSGSTPPIAASKLLGRGANGGTGAAEAVTLGGGLSMSGTTLSASGTAAPALTNGDVTTGTATTTSTVNAAQLKLAATTHAPALSGDANNTLSAPPKFWCGTQANYDAIGSKGANTIYLIQA